VARSIDHESSNSILLAASLDSCQLRWGICLCRLTNVIRRSSFPTDPPLDVSPCRRRGPQAAGIHKISEASEQFGIGSKTILDPLNEDHFACLRTLVALQDFQPRIRIAVKDSDEDVVPEKVGYPLTLTSRPATARCHARSDCGGTFATGVMLQFLNLIIFRELRTT
jgi:hypothetical protein